MIDRPETERSLLDSGISGFLLSSLWVGGGGCRVTAGEKTVASFPLLGSDCCYLHQQEQRRPIPSSCPTSSGQYAVTALAKRINGARRGDTCRPLNSHLNLTTRKTYQSSSRRPFGCFKHVFTIIC